MDTTILERIGLTKGESKVYLALLKLHVTSAGPLFKESQISRSKVYEITTRLIAKGLASSITENGVKKFKALDPRQIPEYLEKQKQLIDMQKKEFQKIIPSLLAQITEQPEQSVEVFEGWSGIKNIFNVLIEDAKKGDVWYAFGIPESLSAKRALFFRQWREKTDNIGIYQKLIANPRIKSSPELAPSSKFSQIRYIDQETPTSVDIFNDCTLLGVWTEKPIVIVMKGKVIADSFRSYFEKLWKSAKK